MRVAVAAAVLLLHALALGSLLQYDARRQTRRHAPVADAHVLRVEFVRRAKPHRPRAVAGPGRRSRDDVGSARAARTPAGAVPALAAVTTAAVAETTPSVLDLRVRVPEPTGPAPPTPFERRREIEPRTTRFAAGWVPAGDAITQARFRSAAVDVALGAFGGPPRRCSEVEHRLRRPDCLPPEDPPGTRRPGHFD